MIILFCIWQWYRLLTQLCIFYSRLSEFIKNHIIFWCLTACFNEISSSRGNSIYWLIDQMWDGESWKMPVCHVLLLNKFYNAFRPWLRFVYLNEFSTKLKPSCLKIWVCTCVQHGYFIQSNCPMIFWETKFLGPVVQKLHGYLNPGLT
jgi:hypothetical protein